MIHESYNFLNPLVALYSGERIYLNKYILLIKSAQLWLSSDHQSRTWGVRLGQLLLAAKKQDADTFCEKLKLVRNEQVVPLSAASYECGTYQRGYEYIIRSVCRYILSACRVL